MPSDSRKNRVNLTNSELDEMSILRISQAGHYLVRSKLGQVYELVNEEFVTINSSAFQSSRTHLANSFVLENSNNEPFGNPVSHLRLVISYDYTSITHCPRLESRS